MKYFLIAYETRTGQLQELTVFDDSMDALAARFAREMKHAAESSIEIALLRAESEEDLHESHARYFSSLGELVDRERSSEVNAEHASAVAESLSR